MNMFKKVNIPIQLKNLVTLRDNGMCQNCGVKGKIEKGIDRSYLAYEYRESIVSRIQKWNPPQIEKISMEISHIVPEFSGGKTVAENLVLMCRFCNRSIGIKIWRKKE